ncbi:MULTISPECIES: RusA family crossover junction endodeoxyribonuclease [unclassified Yoonia]|uniref:RusA family crossover junction endodeoxyribonuclease n=1 Tax=unclassified Yoonia TaxID=2629118 RepID=UPI002AFDF09A|nr:MULTISPECIES: RusA family crossover junction endodeoxyribonuclease [unclassified Yoonia]
MLEITARGHPRPQPRPRFVKGRVVSTLGELPLEWRAKVSSAIKRDMRRTPEWPFGCKLELIFVMPTKDKKRHGKSHLMRPDTDNLAKLVMDVLEERGALPRGDADVCDLNVVKIWGSADQAGVFVRMTPSEATHTVPASLAC